MNTALIESLSTEDYAGMEPAQMLQVSQTHGQKTQEALAIAKALSNRDMQEQELGLAREQFETTKANEERKIEIQSLSEYYKAQVAKDKLVVDKKRQASAAQLNEAYAKQATGTAKKLEREVGRLDQTSKFFTEFIAREFDIKGYGKVNGATIMAMGDELAKLQGEPKNAGKHISWFEAPDGTITEAKYNAAGVAELAQVPDSKGLKLLGGSMQFTPEERAEQSGRGTDLNETKRGDKARKIVNDYNTATFPNPQIDPDQRPHIIKKAQAIIADFKSFERYNNVYSEIIYNHQGSGDNRPPGIYGKRKDTGKSELILPIKL